MGNKHGRKPKNSLKLMRKRKARLAAALKRLKKNVKVEQCDITEYKRENGGEAPVDQASTSGVSEPQSIFPAAPKSPPPPDSPDFPPTPPSPGNAAPQADSTDTKEKEIPPEIPITPVAGRRIVDIVHVFNKLKDISNHNVDSNCGIQYLTLLGERKNGLLSEFKFECELCDSTFFVHSDGEKENNINLDATRAIVASKMRLNQFNTAMKTLEVPVFAEACFHEGKPVALEEARAEVVRSRLAAIARMKRLKDSGDTMLDVIGEGVWQPKRPKVVQPRKKVTPKPPDVPKKPVRRTDPEERRQRHAQPTSSSSKDDSADTQPIEFCSIGTANPLVPESVIVPTHLSGSESSQVLPQLSILPGLIILPGASNVAVDDPGPSNVGLMDQVPGDYSVIYDEGKELLTIQEIKQEPT